MNNALFIFPKQLCSPFASPTIVFNAFGAAARRSFSVRSLASIAFVQTSRCGLIEPKSLGASKDRNAGDAVCRPARNFHAACSFLKRDLGRNDSSKHLARNAARVKIPFGAILKAQLADIYGRDVDYVEGNKFLRMLHERRVVGSLIDKGAQPEEPTTIPAESFLKALEWLRKHHPVDEKSAAEEWTAQEAASIQDKYIADAERLGLYTPSEDLNQESSYNTSTSVIEEYKKFNEEKRAREKESSEKPEQTEESQETQELALTREERREIERTERAEKIAARREIRAEKGQIVLDVDPAVLTQTTQLQRVIAPTIFGVVFIGLLTLAAAFYTPVKKSDRMFPDVPVSVATVGSIVLLNVSIWLLWKIPMFWRTFNTYFVQFPVYPYALSVLTNGFSHKSIKHLFANMGVGLCLFGIDLHEDIGRAAFVDLYLTGVVTGSLFSLFYHVIRQEFSVYTHGASGGVFAVFAAWTVINYSKPLPSPDTHELTLYISRWAVATVMLLSNLFRFPRLGIDWMSHLGGCAVGFLFVRLMSPLGMTKHSTSEPHGEEDGKT